MRKFSREILDHTKKMITKFDAYEWFSDQNFSFFLLKSKIDAESKLSDLTEEEIDFFVNLALENAEVYELLQIFVSKALEADEEIPAEIYNIGIYVFAEKITKPRKSRTNKQDTKDFVLLSIAQVIASKFDINVGRNDSSNKTSAFDYVEKALQELNSEGALNPKVRTSFNALSRLRGNKPNVIKEVDKLMRLISRQSDKSV